GAPGRGRAFRRPEPAGAPRRPRRGRHPPRNPAARRPRPLLDAPRVSAYITARIHLATGGPVMNHAARHRNGPAAPLVLVLSLLFAPPGAVLAQNGTLTEEAYTTPPPEIADFVLAPRHENVSVSSPSPDRRWFVKLRTDGLPRMADFARSYYNLVGVQLDPAASRARSLTTRRASG